MQPRTRVAFLCIASLVAAMSVDPASAATLTVVNVDSPGVGFNDPTPTAPVGGNGGATLGEQRLIAVQRAADIWGEILPSDVGIRIAASWGALSCSPTFGFLGFAGARALESDFDGAEYPSTWYPIALANKLARMDLDPEHDDIDVAFNLEVGSADCLTGLTWYLGLDNGASSTEFDLVTTALHEIAHGLGSLEFVDDATGSLPGGQIDVYSRLIFDSTANKRWDQMTDAERAASAIRSGALVWDGAAVTSAAPGFLGARPVLNVATPAAIAGTYRIGTATFGAPLTLAGIEGELVLVDDAVDMASDACDSIVNTDQLAGKIALIDRGGCPFVTKAKAAQDAGAIGAVIVNNSPGGGVITMGGSDSTIVIPVVMTSYEDGMTIRAELSAGVRVRLHLDPDLMAGADDTGRVLLYAPNPNQPGSSVSHWDLSAFPDLLMEPNIPDAIPQNGDLTVALFRDIGWFNVPDPVTVEDLKAFSSPDGVVVAWELGFEARRDLEGIAVQRARSPDGPYADLTRGLLAPRPAMSYLDTDVHEDLAYWYRLLLVNASGSGEPTQGIGVVFRPAAMATALLAAFEDADGGVHLSYCLGGSSTPVELQIYSVTGRRIRVLHQGLQSRGVHRTIWNRLDADGNRVVRGVYFLRLRAGPAKPTMKVVLLR